MTSDGKSDNHGSQPIIPNGEIPCVWMLAGVLNFRLCDRDLACADCPLEHALRNTSRVPADLPRERAARTTPGGCLIPEDRFFHPGHTWVRLLPGGEFEVGIDDFGRRVAGEAARVELPRTGELLTAGDASVEIAGRGWRIRLQAPFSGEVTGANGALEDEPALIRTAPYGAGYLYRARPGDPARALEGLIPSAAAPAFMGGQEFLLRALVDVALARTGQSITLNDGGLLSDDLLAGVPPVKADRIREWIFNAPMTGREARER